MTHSHSTANPSQLTLLTTKGVIAVKTYTQRPDKKVHVEGYGRAKRFTHDVIDVDERGAWLRKLAPMRESFVILGHVVSEKRTIRRLSTDRDGQDATIVDVPRLWMPVDVDQLDFEPMSKMDDGEGFALELMDRLGIKSVRCVWHLTNSHGFDGKYRARLWLRLDEPATCEDMKEFARARWGDLKVDVMADGEKKMKPMVDLAVYRPAQPIYTGDPIFLEVTS